jgi:hypothetical protein
MTGDQRQLEFTEGKVVVAGQTGTGHEEARMRRHRLRRHRLRRIGVLSAIRVSFFLSWVAGVLLACVYGVLYHFAFRFNPESFEAQLEQMGVGTNGAVFVLVGGLLLSIACAFVGVFGGGVLAVAYNALARVVGGIEVELEAAAGIGRVGRRIPPRSKESPDPWPQHGEAADAPSPQGDH